MTLDENGNQSPQLIISNMNYIYELIEARNYTPKFEIVKNEEYFPCKSFLEGLEVSNLVNRLPVMAPERKVSISLIIDQVHVAHKCLEIFYFRQIPY
jgi:hypothetical protein